MGLLFLCKGEEEGEGYSGSRRNDIHERSVAPPQRNS
jgi:hypothetical protein